MSQHGVMGWCDHSLPGGDALEQHAGQLEEGVQKGRWVIRGRDENRELFSVVIPQKTRYNAVPSDCRLHSESAVQIFLM